jgi:alanine racemase
MTRQRNGQPSRAWVEVDLGALQRNGALLARRSAVPLLPMIKADAYGLGAVAVAKALEALEPWGYGVATVEEGEELRAAGIERPLVVFTPLLSDDMGAARAARLTLGLSDAPAIKQWAALGGSWHLAIETGMNRGGVRWDEVDRLLPLIAEHPPEGAFTHFHSAEIANGSREEQERRFANAIARLPARPPVLHCENSPALERRAASPWTLVRPGVFLYGVDSGPGSEISPEPVAAIRARVVALRKVEDGETVSYAATYRAVGRRTIATVAIGYADGYRRSLSNRGTGLVHGRRAPVVGLVTMDMTMLDVTDTPCEVGDVVTMLGRDGDEEIPLAGMARASDLSPYELLTGLRLRLPRTYREASP